MGLKSQVTNVVSAATEEIVRPVTNDTMHQLRPPMPKEDIKMLYGDFGQVPPDDKIKNSMEFHGMRDSQNLERVRQEHAQILGNNTNQTPGEQQPVLNPFSKNQTDKVSRYQVRTAVQVLKSNAEDLGVTPQNAGEQKARKEELEAEEKAKKEAEIKMQLDDVVEAPRGKITGLSFKRKRPTLKMQKPPKSAETRASQGVGG